MRIITLQRKTLDGEPCYKEESPIQEWWCAMESKEEEIVYDDFVKHLGEYSGDCRDILWNKLVIYAGRGMGVAWGDDDMYGYIRPDEYCPGIGEELVDGDGDIWVRVE